MLFDALSNAACHVSPRSRIRGGKGVPGTFGQWALYVNGAGHLWASAPAGLSASDQILYPRYEVSMYY